MQRIGDYAVIGDCRSAALVSRDASIDWLCWPRFDSPSIFAAILDDAAGRWRVAPVAPFSSERWYVDATNVLQTRLRTSSGSVVVTDLMPVASGRDQRELLLPDHEILRIAECEAGEVEIEMTCEPRPDYARRRARVRTVGKLGVRFEIDATLLLLRTDMPIESGEDGRVRGRIRLRAGEAAHASLTFAHDWPAVLPPLGEWSRQAVERSVAWWRSWTARIDYDGPGRDAVLRSALALKLLVYAPSGAVVAAPTTSLPERPGGDLNWDYRFCWLRDASLTVRALFGLGYHEEADAFTSWLLQATRLTQPELNVLYDVYGNSPADERILDHLAGYDGARPVRIGNAAAGQRQLDVYGEVIDAATHFVRAGGAFDSDTRRMLCAFGRYVCRHWHEPDEGIWEPRSGRAHHTHSRVLCWTALERLIQLHAAGHLGDTDVSELRRHRDMIRRDVEEHAWNPAIDSYAARYGSDDLDASLLLLPWYGFEAAASDRMRRTYERIRDRLGAGNGLLYRYKDDESPGERAFGICSFWGAEFLALGGGSAADAAGLFDRLCRYANDVGLFGEEIDPSTGEAWGNFPQGFTHVGLINAAISLASRLKQEPVLERKLPPRGEAAAAPKRRV